MATHGSLSAMLFMLAAGVCLSAATASWCAVRALKLARQRACVRSGVVSASCVGFIFLLMFCLVRGLFLVSDLRACSLARNAIETIGRGELPKFSPHMPEDNRKVIEAALGRLDGRIVEVALEDDMERSWLVLVRTDRSSSHCFVEALPTSARNEWRVPLRDAVWPRIGIAHIRFEGPEITP